MTTVDNALNWQQNLVEWVTGQGQAGRAFGWGGEGEKPSSWRLFPLWLAMVLAFVFLESRAVYLMLLEGRAYGKRAQENRILRRRLIAPRGIVYDRNRAALSRNVPAFRLVQEDTFRLVDRQTALMIEATQEAEIVVDSVRTYPTSSLFAHLIGYTSEITREELTQSGFAAYRPGDRLGRGGVEETFEDQLRGVNGQEMVEVNAQGDEVRKLAFEAPSPGRNLVLTVDANLQKVAAAALEKKLEESELPSGAVVVSDPRSGAVLSLVSLPSFNPNLFIKGEAVELSKVLFDPASPLLNRAIGGVYPPGSTLKPAVAAGALEAGVITPETIIEDTGIMYLGPYSFTNWYFTQYGKTEGPLDLVGALRRSNDIYFYQVGQRLGPENLRRWLGEFGFGRKLGIDLPGEAAGLVGSDQWKREMIGEPWYPGDTLHLAIGQGFIQVTPLQINMMTAVFANGGSLWQPRVVSAIGGGEGEMLEVKPRVIGADLVEPDYLQVVREGMRQACLKGGTGWPLFEFPVSLGCKTGTAEVGDEEGKTDAWFTVFAPFEDPQVVVTVLLERGGEGSSDAAPVAREILEWWFGPRQPS